MNRHARRKLEREFTPSDRAAWNERMVEFSTATKGVAETFIIMPRDQETLAGAAEAGNSTARAILDAIIGWFDCADAQPKPPMCLACDITFHGGVNPQGFVILMPFAADPMCAITTGVCAHCATRDDLLATATQQWRRLWPGLHTIPRGRA
jgi:hypothetical protein